MQWAKGFPTLLWLFLFLVYFPNNEALAAKLIGVRVLDKDYLVVHLSDGEVIHHEDGKGEEIIRYTAELDTGAAVQTGNWTITPSQDMNYSGDGQNPQNSHRKKKLSGHAQMAWSESDHDFLYEYTYDHWIFLLLPSALQQEDHRGPIENILTTLLESYRENLIPPDTNI